MKFFLLIHENVISFLWTFFSYFFAPDGMYEGKIYLLDRRGLSIVSDIDDTIKISEVIDKIRLVANTFIHGFRVVEGKSIT